VKLVPNEDFYGVITSGEEDSFIKLKLDAPPGKSVIISFSNCIGMADFDVYKKTMEEDVKMMLNKQKYLGRYQTYIQNEDSSDYYVIVKSV
jgi:hypothetical protein